MTMTDLPLTKIFWTIFALEAAVTAFMLYKALGDVGNYKASNGGLVGAWLVLIPVVGLALVAGLFLVFQAPMARAGLVLLLLYPVLGPVVLRPIVVAVQYVKNSREQAAQERWRRGEHIFPEEGQRKLAAAIADRDLQRIQAALPGAGDLNRLYDDGLPYGTPLGKQETLLTFALHNADDTEATVQVIQLLLAAGADPNLPRAKPLSRAISTGPRVTETLLRAGADVNACVGSADRPVWWSVLEKGPYGTTDAATLQLLLDHGADTRKRLEWGLGPIEIAVETERWGAVAVLARLVPGARDLVVPTSPYSNQARAALHLRLAREVQALRDADQPVPADMSAAMAALGLEPT